MKKAHLFLFFGLTLLLFSCKKDDPPIISVSPSGSQINVDPGDLTEFNVELKAGDFELRNVVITAKPTGGVTSVLLDSTVYGKEAQFFYVYEAPFGTSDVILTFTIYDEEGNKNATARRMMISGTNLLSENSGFELYSKYATSAINAFNIGDLTSLQLGADPDSIHIDLVEYDETDDGELNYALTSYSGIKFVRNNSFNYPEATQQSAYNTYSSSTALSIVDNISVNDILITEYDTINHLFAVVKITAITNQTASSSDKYTFNLKK
ncbi:MAG: hypothetical protein RLZZ77_704 [Bacteroidota bacterium]